VQHSILDAATTKVEFHSATAPVDNETDSDKQPSPFPHNPDHFTNGAACSDDILAHQHPFATSNLEPAPKLHRTILPLCEHCAGSKLSPDLLSHDNPTECRCNHNLDLMSLEAISNFAAQQLCMLRILQDLCTLKVLIAMEARG
jgi:hypothetical protein